MKPKLNEKLAEAVWNPASRVQRPFVRYINTQGSSGSVWHEKCRYSGAPLISVIIPTSDAFRHGYFPSLLAQIDSQTSVHFELIVVRDDQRQGRAINTGAALAEGKYLLTLDDDTSLPDPETFKKLTSVMEAHQEIGIAGGNNVVPEDARPFIRCVMKQIPRRSWKPVQDITDSDLAEHPCLIMRRKEFMAVGGENELIPRGLDPYLREEFRKSGKRVVVVPGVIYHHLPPDNLHKLLAQFFRNGRQAAFTNRNYPEWVIETPQGHGSFKTRIPLPLRLLRFPTRLLQALIFAKPIWFLSEVSYALGFAYEWFSARDFHD